MEKADKPSLSNNSATFDRFGFRIDEGESLEDKAEKLRRQAVDHHDQLDEGVCQVSNFEIQNSKFETRNSKFEARTSSDQLI